MKLRKELIDECVKWVEINGLYPQKGGATVKMFCSAMGISDETYRRWCKNVGFVARIKKGNEIFASQTTREVVNALKKKALGFSDFKIEQYGIPSADGKGVITEKIKRIEQVIPPDTAACIFLLTNLDPDNWKNRQNIDADVDATVEEKVLSKKEAKEFLRELDEKL